VHRRGEAEVLKGNLLDMVPIELSTEKYILFIPWMGSRLRFAGMSGFSDACVADATPLQTVALPFSVG
jgi:hypothetical protein